MQSLVFVCALSYSMSNKVLKIIVFRVIRLQLGFSGFLNFAGKLLASVHFWFRISYGSIR